MIQPMIESTVNKILGIPRLLSDCQIAENKLPKTNRVRLDELVNDNKIAPKPPKPFLLN